MPMSEEDKKKYEEKERKKAEVRKRLEDEAKAKKGKKGFMTPERKKKLKMMIRKMAAEELKREQERKAESRRKIIRDRTGNPKHDESGNEATYMKACKDYHERIRKIHESKYDLEFEVKQKEKLIIELNGQVKDLRGKFIKPTLKKVSKYEQKLEKMATVAAKKRGEDFTAALKKTKSQVMTAQEEETASKEKPEWAVK